MLNSCTCYDHSHITVLKRAKPKPARIYRLDPTRTTTLRMAFVAAMWKRFNKLKGDIRKTIVDRDCFGLQQERFMMVNEPVPMYRAFDFPTSSDKVKAFMEWLHDQQDQGILGIIEREGRTITHESEWMKTYIDSAYKKGILRAQTELSKMNIPTYRPLDIGFLAPIHADRVGLLYTRAYEGLKGITEDMAKSISQVLSDGIVKGLHPIQIAKALNQRVDAIGINRARMLARTEVIRAHSQANLAEFREAGIEGVEVEVEWGTAGIGVCEKCLELEGKRFTLEEAEGLIPYHPNCLIESSRVSAEGITATSERWYDGDVLILTTAGGKNLTCTPNHPILTESGFISACSLNIGSGIICGFPGNLDSSGSSYGKDIPPTIHEITELFRRSGKVSTKEVKVSSPDFHGDGIGSDIAIIRTNSELRSKFNSSISQHLPKDFFKLGDMRKTFLLPFGSMAKILKRTLHSFDGFMCRFNLIISFFFGHLCPSKLFGFALCSDMNIGLNETSTNSPTVNIKFFRQGKFTHTGSIKRTDLINRKISFPIISRGISSGYDSTINNFMSDSELLSYISNGSAGKVFIDKIVDIKVRRFFGHVYNLQTEKGYYLAEGIFTHNCKCAFIPHIIENKENGQYPTA